MRPSHFFVRRDGSKNDLVGYLKGHGLLEKTDYDYLPADVGFTVICLSEKATAANWQHFQIDWALTF